jgi:Glycosyl hydrolases family 17
MPRTCHLLPLLLLFLLLRSCLYVESSVGVNWGTLSSHRISPPVVVDLLRQNKIPKVKLFDTDPVILRALMGSGIEVMVGIPNEFLGSLASSISASDAFVAQNISRFLVKGGTDIRFLIIFFLFYCPFCSDISLL